MGNNQLLIFCILEPEIVFLKKYMSRIFGEQIDIITCTQKDLEAGMIPDPQTVLISVDEDMPIVQKYFKKKRIIKVERMLACNNIEEIMMLPENKELIVVNNPQDCALETIDSLAAMGVNHLKLIPYWPGCGKDLSGYDTVVYPGFIEYVPKVFKNYIDIGYRHIAFSTIFEISNEFGLDYPYIKKIYEETISLLVKKNYELRRFLDKSLTSERSFRWVCDMNKEGIICIDAENKITICNPEARQLLGKDSDEIIQMDYRNVIPKNSNLQGLIAQRKKISDSMMTICDKKVIINTYEVEIGNIQNYLINIMLVEKIQQTEIDVRKKLNQKGFWAKYTFNDIRGKSTMLCDAVVLAERYAKSNLNILITGESGTGKELFAQAIHNASAREKAPFVAINFAAIPENLAESELFGYEEGAFTGAVKGGKPGLFELAHKGTLFLDEIGDASLSVQARLLRVLEEREVMRIGSSRYIPVDVRVICATNRNLHESEKRGAFRKDLLFRLDVLPLHIPNLRDRKDDIIPILDSICAKYGITRVLTNELLNKFLEYDWPGNIRELKSAIQYLSVIGKDTDICNDAEFFKFVETYFKTKREYEKGEITNAPQKPWSGELLVLESIRKANILNERIGRGSLLTLLAKQNIMLTEAQLKIILKKLRENGLITQGKTKQGAHITKEGQQLLIETEGCAE